MSRRRLAVAHFSEKAAAERVRQVLLERGGHPSDVAADASIPHASCRVEVVLVAAVERPLLDVLLSSEAIRVDVHDV